MRGLEGEFDLLSQVILHGLKEATKPLVYCVKLDDGYEFPPDYNDRLFFEEYHHAVYCDILGVCPHLIFDEYQRLLRLNATDRTWFSDCGRYRYTEL